MEKLIVIKTLDQLTQLVDSIKDVEYVALDTETTGVEKDSKIIGFSVAWDVDTGYYVVLRYWDPVKQELIDLETISKAKDFMELLKQKSLIMHNGVFDCNMVKNNYDVDLIDSLHTDTMILAHLLDENRSAGLKELGTIFYGEDAKAEQLAMKESVSKNGGVLTKDNYELFKADADLMAKYGAKDAILTIKIFYQLLEDLYEQGLEDFFYKDESMPLLKGPTYQLNTTGLRVDAEKLQKLKGQLEADCMTAKAFIYKEITPIVKDKYPGDKKTNVFNIGSPKQLSWLMFVRLGNEFSTLTKEGRSLCKALNIKLPYSPKAKRDFIALMNSKKGEVYDQARFNPKTKKLGRPKKIGDVWNYIAADKATLKKYSTKYDWVAKFLVYNKNLKLLTTYVEGIQERMKYGIIRPSFLQHGTTSGRYSSRNPNFQNLPRDDKRIKECIVSRPGKVFVGADYSQLEPRVFASFSGDERLLACFASGDDFYSVIGVEVFDKHGCSLKKDDPNSFAEKHPDLRKISKAVALSATYGTTAPKMASSLGKSIQEAQEIIDDYFEKFPKVKKLMLKSHEMAKQDGYVDNLYGRRRRIPKAKLIPQICGKSDHADIPYELRNLLNLSINHRIQSTGASIMNRAAIAVYDNCRLLAQGDTRWLDVRVVLQVHDQLILEGPEAIAEDMVIVLKDAMENTVQLPGVSLQADPTISKDLAGQK